MIEAVLVFPVGVALGWLIMFLVMRGKAKSAQQPMPYPQGYPQGYPQPSASQAYPQQQMPEGSSPQSGTAPPQPLQQGYPQQ